MDAETVRRTVRLDGAGETVMRRAYDRGTLSPRGHDRVLRVARTIADLTGREAVGAEHVLEALAFRQDAEGDPNEDVA
jgi:magnesium chelatase family protein